MKSILNTLALFTFLFGFSTTSLAADAARESHPPQPIRIGAVAYAPSAVTIFHGLTRYLNENGLASDYILYSNYDSLVKALKDGEIDIAWNTPLAHAQYHVQAGGRSQTLVMRDVDCNIRSTLVVRQDSDIKSTADLAGKSLVLGSNQAAEATVLPLHFLKKEGVDFKQRENRQPRRRSRQQRQPLRQPRVRPTSPPRRPRRRRHHHHRPLEPREKQTPDPRFPNTNLDLTPLQPLRLHSSLKASTKTTPTASPN